MIFAAACTLLLLVSAAAVVLGRRWEGENRAELAALQAEGKLDDIDVRLLVASCRSGMRMNPRRPRRR